jgi:hypothetical protein
MRRNVIVTSVVVVAVLALGAQLAIPAYLSSKVEDRLTRDGGSAHVEINAFPATKLIGGGGDRIQVRGSGLVFDPLTSDDTEPVFSRLDKFDQVDARLDQVRSGPFLVQRFRLERSDNGRPYELAIDMSVTAADLTAYASSRYGGPLGGWLGGMASSLVPFNDTRVPLHLTAAVRSNGGRAEVVSASGDLAGLPVDPIAKRLASAVARVL